MARAGNCPDFRALVQSSQSDEKLRELLANCFHDDLTRMARARCRDVILADDAAQDALLTALEALGSFRGEARIEHWLRQLVRSACSRLRRGRKNDPAFNRPVEDLPPQADVDPDQRDQEAIVLLQERLALLRQALDSLPTDNRELFLLREAEDLSVAELAQRLGTTANAVKSKLKRTRAQLRTQIIELAQGEDPESR